MEGYPDDWVGTVLRLMAKVPADRQTAIFLQYAKELRALPLTGWHEAQTPIQFLIGYYDAHPEVFDELEPAEEFEVAPLET